MLQLIEKYTVPFTESESTEDLRSRLAGFYAQRTLRAGPFFRATAPMLSYGWQVMRVLKQPDTSSL